MPQDQSDNNPVVNIPASAVPPQMANAPHPYEQQLTEIIVDGEKQTVTHSKLVELAQKGVSSASRFQEASAKSKEADSAIALKADLEILAETGDISAFRRAGASMGLTGDEVEEAARIVYESMGESPNNPSSPGEDQFNDDGAYDGRASRGQEGREGSVSQRIAALEAALSKTTAILENKRTNFGDLDESLQVVVTDVEQARVDKIIQKALDSDEIMSYYMKTHDTNGQRAIRDMIDEKVRGRLDASDGKFGNGIQILREVIPEVKSTLEALGTLNRSTPQMGLGPAPGGQGAEIYPTKQPDHVSSTDPGFDEHISETLAHNVFKAQQGN
jgi:hypothetical protein